MEGSVAPAGKKTLETLGAADSIAEALEMAANERQRHEVSYFAAAHMELVIAPDCAAAVPTMWRTKHPSTSHDC